MKNSDLKYQAENVFNTLIDLLNELKWEFLADKKNLTATCVLSGKDFPVHVEIFCDKMRGIVSVSSKLSFTTFGEQSKKVAFAICMINSVLPEGNFDYDYDLGKIVFRTGLVYRDSVVSREAFLHLITVTLNTVDEYNDKLFTVGKGFLDLFALEEYLYGEV